MRVSRAGCGAHVQVFGVAGLRGVVEERAGSERGRDGAMRTRRGLSIGATGDDATSLGVGVGRFGEGSSAC